MSVRPEKDVPWLMPRRQQVPRLARGRLQQDVPAGWEEQNASHAGKAATSQAR